MPTSWRRAERTPSKTGRTCRLPEPHCDYLGYPLRNAERLHSLSRIRTRVAGNPANSKDNPRSVTKSCIETDDKSHKLTSQLFVSTSRPAPCRTGSTVRCSGVRGSTRRSEHRLVKVSRVFARQHAAAMFSYRSIASCGNLDSDDAG